MDGDTRMREREIAGRGTRELRGVYIATDAGDLVAGRFRKPDSVVIVPSRGWWLTHLLSDRSRCSDPLFPIAPVTGER